jgi:hypothetical protein
MEVLLFQWCVKSSGDWGKGKFEKRFWRSGHAGLSIQDIKPLVAMACEADTMRRQ